MYVRCRGRKKRKAFCLLVFLVLASVLWARSKSTAHRVVKRLPTQADERRKTWQAIDDLPWVEAKPEARPRDNETFVDCFTPGYMDTSGYPLIDARTVFCGDLMRNKQNEALIEGLISISYATKCNDALEKMCDLAIALHHNLVFALTNVTALGDHEFIAASDVALINKDSGDILPVTRRDSPTDLAYFLPKSLSSESVVMSLLRGVASHCTAQVPMATTYLATVHNLQHGLIRYPPFCLYVEKLGSSIKQAYVASPEACDEASKSTLCTIRSLLL